MEATELREFCRALDVEWPATLEQLDEARRLQAQVWHPDRHQHSEALRRKGEEKLKRVNGAYKALRAYLLAGGGASCPGCGGMSQTSGGLCSACQRQAELDGREKELSRRERDLKKREIAEPPAPRYVNISGRWTGASGAWCHFAGNGPNYEYYGGGVLGQTETGTAQVAGTAVTVQGRNVLLGNLGDFSATFTIDGSRLRGMAHTPMGSAAVEFWKA